MLIPNELHGQRIDSVLAQLIPAYSRSQLTVWLKEGKITVNNKCLKPKDKILGGEQVSLDIDSFSLKKDVENYQPENIPLSIIYEDNELLVINKPSGLVVHPGAGNHEHTLLNALLFHDPSLANLPRAGIVHRLDKETTGLLVVAKTLESHVQLTRQMQARTIRRSYITLVQGHIISGGEINTGYGRHPRNRLKMAVCESGKEAITHYTIRKYYHFYTLLDVQLQTGRTHQIRVHMAHINHPVFGDPLYGGRLKVPRDIDKDFLLNLQQFKRQALHAIKLSFIHPTLNTLLTFEAPIPDDFKTLLTDLDNYFV